MVLYWPLATTSTFRNYRNGLVLASYFRNVQCFACSATATAEKEEKLCAGQWPWSITVPIRVRNLNAAHCIALFHSVTVLVDCLACAPTGQCPVSSIRMMMPYFSYCTLAVPQIR